MWRFKHVIVVIIVSISVLFVFNIVCLKGLFHSIEADTERVISSCIEEADNREMQIRMDTLSRYSDDIHLIMIDKSFRPDSTSETGTLQTTIRSIRNDNDTATRVRSEALAPNRAAFSQLLSEIRATIHQNMDDLLPVDLQRLDSLLAMELENRGIHSEVYYTEIIDKGTGAVLRTSRGGASGGSTDDDAILYTFDQENGYAYRVHIASLTRIVFQQMSGILVTTFLIIVLLGIAFWYLIRTVMQQKTLEEMKDDFTNNMTHELKTPIAVAYAAVDTLLNFSQGDDREKRKKYLQMCMDQLTHLAGLVEQILSVSRERGKSITLQASHVEVKAMIDQLIELHQVKAKKEVEFRACIRPEELTVYADPVHLNNIISNLIDNAIKYSGEKAAVEITACREEAFHVLTVKDHGIGIAPDHIEHIFDRFYRVPSGYLHNVKGYGLGLFYVRQMVEKHNGSISVKSGVNKGSVFTIKLPIQ
ncbi:MAG: HAMP domain-containing histidine kinase [Tannerellaceae bacterium]|jgi:signal transduction histidine kinase|nr:HAMP domain-containing histidine kinase [Tannerellaceae bacterium]